MTCSPLHCDHWSWNNIVHVNYSPNYDSCKLIFTCSTLGLSNFWTTIFYFIFWWFKLCIKNWSLKIGPPYYIIWLVINVICDMCSIIPTIISLLHKLTLKRHNMIQGCLQARVSIFWHHNVTFFCTFTYYNVFHVKKIITLIKNGLNYMIII